MRFFQTSLVALAGCGAFLASAGMAATTSTNTATTQAEATGVSAHQADHFVDSIGVNVHMGDVGSVYGNFTNLKSALLALGVRHLRDGLNESKDKDYFTNHNALGALGIKSIFTTSTGQTPQLWQSFPSLMNQSFEGYENPNEMDDGKGPNWLSELVPELPALSDAVRGNPNSFPVYGPALVYSPSYSELGNVAQYFDYGNLHNYPGGQYPETVGWGARDTEGNLYGCLAWNVDLLHIDSPGLPWLTTETGYTNEESLAYYVPQSVAAVYLPRLILNNWAGGATRTYIYELVSDLGGDYGLIGSNWQYKPDFYALANLLNLLSDPGPSFNPSSLAYTVSGGGSNVHQILFQKRDGSFYLAIWLGESSYNTATRQPIAVASESITVQLPNGLWTTRYQWNTSGKVTTSAPTSASPYKLTLTDKLTILKISSQK
jgi:hypothetical protein